MTAKTASTKLEKTREMSGTSESKPKPRRVRVNKPEPKVWYVIGSKRSPDVFEGEPVHQHVLAGPFNREVDAELAAGSIKHGIRTDILIATSMVGFVLLTLLLLSLQS